MASHFDPRQRRAIIDRIDDRLTPEREPVWGRFTAPEMVCNVRCGLRNALGEMETGPPSRRVLQHKHLDHHLRQFGV